MYLLRPFFFYSHHISDVIITHLMAISLLQINQSMLSGITFSLDAILIVFLSIPCTWLVKKINPSQLGNISLFLRFFMLCTACLLISIPIKEKTLYVSLICFSIFKLASHCNNYLCIELPFRMQENYSVSLGQIFSIKNSLIRGSTALAPPLALLISNNTHYSKIILTFFFITIFFLSIWHLKDMLLCPSPLVSNQENRQNTGIFDVFKSVTARWCILFQLLGNLTLGGIAFLFLSVLSEQSGYVLNEITILYSTFFIVQISVLIFSEKKIPIRSFHHIVLALLLISALLITYGFTLPKWADFLLSGCTGAIYAALLISMNTLFMERLKGDLFREYVGWANTIGKTSSISSTMLISLALTMKISSFVLFTFCGSIGLVASLILYYLLRQHRL